MSGRIKEGFGFGGMALRKVMDVGKMKERVGGR